MKVFFFLFVFCCVATIFFAEQWCAMRSDDPQTRIDYRLRGICNAIYTAIYASLALYCYHFGF